MYLKLVAEAHQNMIPTNYEELILFHDNTIMQDCITEFSPIMSGLQRRTTAFISHQEVDSDRS